MVTEKPVRTQSIMDKHWMSANSKRGRETSKGRALFSDRMYKTSKEMIEFYLPKMDEATKNRALKTLEKLARLIDLNQVNLPAAEVK